MHENNYACRVILDSGAEYLAVLLTVGHGLGIGENGISVSGNNANFIFALAIYGKHNVLRTVNIYTLCTNPLKPGFAILGTLVLKVRGCGYVAKLEKSLVHAFGVFRNKRLYIHVFAPYYCLF